MIMRILITENQLISLVEKFNLKPMSNEVFQKYFAFVFNRISKRFNYKPCSSSEWVEEIQKYDNGYLYNWVFHYIYKTNVRPGINWGSDQLGFPISDLEVAGSVTNLPNKLSVRFGLYIKNNLIEVLPDNLDVSHEIIATGSDLKKLGNNLKTKILNISDTSIREIPNNLNVNTFIITNTPLSLNYTEEELTNLIKEKGGSVKKILGSEKNKIMWRPSNYTSTYTFERNTPNSLTNKFIDYVITQNEKNEPATRRDFLQKLGHHDFNRGYLSTFFSSIKNAGIVTMNTQNEYSLGQNYQAYKEGRLKRKRRY